jgi:AraC-like DNA-binding protein
MKPFIENVLNSPSYDWSVREFSCQAPVSEFSCSWHYHTEYELVLYDKTGKGFVGNYFAGDAINPVHDQTMLLYGPGLPHMINGRFDNPEQTLNRTIVVWFTHQWTEKIRSLIPDIRGLQRLLEAASYGVEFSHASAQKIAALFNGIEQLDRSHQAVKVIEMLLILAEDKNTRRVSSSAYRIQPVTDDDSTLQRITKATRYIEKNYSRAIRVEDLCQALHISESSAYRLFEKHYGMSFSEHLKQYRIGKACELLARTNLPIALVAEKSGFSNLSNFNRLFKGAKSITPSVFRRQFS